MLLYFKNIVCAIHLYFHPSLTLVAHTFVHLVLAGFLVALYTHYMIYICPYLFFVYLYIRIVIVRFFFINKLDLSHKHILSFGAT